MTKPAFSPRLTIYKGARVSASDTLRVFALRTGWARIAEGLACIYAEAILMACEGPMGSADTKLAIQANNSSSECLFIILLWYYYILVGLYLFYLILQWQAGPHHLM